MTYRCDTQTIPDLKLERYLLGELPKAETDAIDKAIKDNLDLQSRLTALKTSNAEINALYPSDEMVRQINARAEGITEGPTHWFKPVLTLAAVLGLAIAMSVWIPGPEIQMLDGVAPNQLQEPTRIKGNARLFLYRKTEKGTESLNQNSVAHQGDRIQIYYHAGDAQFGTILSVDGRGVVTQHLPESGTQAIRLTPGDPIALNHSYQLDDAPKWERFYFITSNNAFDINNIKSALQTSADSLTLSDTNRQFVFTLQKGPAQ